MQAGLEQIFAGAVGQLAALIPPQKTFVGRSELQGAELMKFFTSHRIAKKLQPSLCSKRYYSSEGWPLPELTLRASLRANIPRLRAIAAFSHQAVESVRAASGVARRENGLAISTN